MNVSLCLYVYFPYLKTALLSGLVLVVIDYQNKYRKEEFIHVPDRNVNK